MGITIIYVLVVLFLGVFCKNNRFTNILLAITLFILFAFEHSDQDYYNYLKLYDSVGRGSISEQLLEVEPTFLMFSLWGNDLGLSFNEARAIICVLEVLAIVSTIRVFTSQIAFIIALFLIFPATADAELFRWLGGMSLVIFAFPYLIRGDSKKDYILYSALIILATTIHTSCIFFLVYNLLYLNDKKKILTIVLIASVILFVTAQSSLLYKILAFLPISDSLNEKYQMTEQSNIFGLMALFLRESFIFLVGYLTYRSYKTSNVSIKFTNRRFTLRRGKYSQQQMGLLLCDKLYYINIVSCLLIILAIYTPMVQRLFHVLLFFNTIAAIYLATVAKKKGLKKVTLLCVILTLLLHLANGPQHVAIFMSHFKEGFLVNLGDVIFNGKAF